MSEPKRMSPLYIVFTMLKMLRSLLPLLVIFGFRALGGERVPTFLYWIIGVLVGLLILTGIWEIFGWRRFTYQEESDRLTIRHGILRRTEKIIYYSRIHSVSQEQPLIQRLLGVVQLKIETPGGSEDSDATLPVLPRREAERLQHALNEQASLSASSAKAAGVQEHEERTADELSGSGKETSAPGSFGAEPGSEVQPFSERSANRTAADADAWFPPEAAGPAAAAQSRRQPVLLYRLGPGRLLQAALTEMNLGLAAAFVAAIFSFADDLLPDEWMNRAISNAQAYLTGFRAILIVAAIALLLAWLLSLILFVIKYGGFSLYRDGERLSIRYGLLERKQFLFDPRRVQAVTVRESWLRQALGYAHVELNVVSSSSDKETPALHPFIRRKDIPALLEQTVPQFAFGAAESRPPKRALFAYMRLGLIVSAAAAAISIYFFPHAGLWSLLLFPASAAIDFRHFRDAGVALDGDRLILVNRIFAKRTHCTLRRHIVAFTLSGSRFQRGKKLLTIKAHLIGSPGASSFGVSRLDQADAERLRDWYGRRSAA
ncbi:PH domain-containing protein [Saccharibacillus sp. CPCC 101409]|uniref:PH domain-containing protein n=1 Tax=Saccharibacillus sp. CPCC 101409 TaxID=3058041 RepID=UPI002672E038|nr:PH domain-containing protein [Saccharibacillus sp. CPCC 101409]MDO3412268.1 PH domain-containing protein [Saccharibacillus sp. CPCC 101409]